MPWQALLVGEKMLLCLRGIGRSVTPAVCMSLCHLTTPPPPFQSQHLSQAFNLLGCKHPRIAMNVIQHKTVTYLRHYEVFFFLYDFVCIVVWLNTVNSVGDSGVGP